MPPVNGAGIRNDGDAPPAQYVTVGGSVWRLRCDATDASMDFPHNKVSWIDSGCEFIADDHDYFVWIRGVIPAKEGTQQRPLTVMYIGFHPEKIAVLPDTIYVADIQRMHVYVNESAGFATEFCRQFLGGAESEVREPVKPYPSKNVRKKEPPKVAEDSPGE